MKENNLGKYNVIIADDEPAGISTVMTVIKEAGLSDFFNILVCDFVEEGKDDRTLNILINKLNRLDIAIIDWMWEKEFEGQALEAGGKRAADIVRRKFTDCNIIFSTNFPQDAEDEKIDLKYNAIHLRKETSEAAINQGKRRLENTIKECLKNRLFEIDSSLSSKRQFLQCIQNDVFQWDKTIVIGEEEWTFKNLFFPYKDDLEGFRNIVLSEYGLGHIPLKLQKFNKKTYFGDNLIDYYKLLFFNYNYEIESIIEDVTPLLDKLKILISDPIEENIKEVIKALSEYRILSECPSIFDDEIIAFNKFKEKLIVRLFFMSSYILYNLPAKIIYYLITDTKIVTDEVVKKISQTLFISGMKFTERTEKIYGYMNFDDSRVFTPFLRGYESLIKDSFLKYEKDFLIKYFESFQSDPAMSHWHVSHVNHMNHLKNVFNKMKINR